MTLDTPLNELEFVPPLRARQLARFGMPTVGALLLHFPRRYEDRTHFDAFPNDSTPGPVSICGIVRKTSIRRIGGWKKMFDVLIEQENATALGGRLLLRWFNSHWVEKMIIQGQRLIAFGKVKRSGSNLIISHPEFEVVEDDEETSIHLRRIVPMHGATEGLSPRVIRRLVWDVLERQIDDEIEQLVPGKLDATSRGWAIRQMHFPESMKSLEKARRHLVLEEFLAMQLAVQEKRRDVKSERGAAHSGGGALMSRLHASLPFPLTQAQTRAIAEIRDDLASTRPMNRLLHGDVGSGKTLVAMSAMLLCVEAGWQAALMAPTQILAEQHYLVFRGLLDPLGIRVALRTGARREDAGALPLFEAAGEGGAGSTGHRPVASGDPPDASGETGGPPVAAGGSPAASAQSAAEPSEHRGAEFSKRNLPHFERPWTKYAVEFNVLGDRTLSPAARWLVLNCVLHWHRQRYELYAACVMPDHVHLLIEPRIKEAKPDGSPIFFSLSEILHTVKSFTAHQINDLDSVKGSLWQDERYDRYIRSDRDLEEKFDYICNNPKAAGLVREASDYPWLWYPNRELDDRWRVAHREAGAIAPEFAASRGEQRASGPFHPRREQHSGRVLHPGEGGLPPLPETEPHILIGTHALLYEGAGFTRLGLAVVDEQHKFGVMQRARLREQAGGNGVPDVLVMTATPIPRTLTMTLYGDLDVSTLDEMPAGRGKIITGVRAPEKLIEAAKFIREQLDAGRQAYIVYPLVEESEKLEAKAATAEFKKWSEMLAPHRCELIHGRVPPEEKDAIMERFRSGASKALVATTVIEVGVDVPNATVMLIENAERFGMAQLHQLRGRIGRGAHKSYCILITGDGDDEESMEKLRVLEQTTDGFEIAEADLRLRGPGDMLGTAQSGLPPLLVGDLFRDADLMKLARNYAFLIFEQDPDLERPEHTGCRKLLAANRRSPLGN